MARIARFTSTLAVLALGGLVPSGMASAAGPAPQGLLCETLGTCPPESDDTTVTVDLVEVGGTVGAVIDSTVAAVDQIFPGTADVLGDLPLEEAPPVGPVPTGAVLGASTSGYAEPVLEAAAHTVEAEANGVLDEATDIVDGTLDQAGLGGVVTADADVPVHLSNGGIVVDPTALATIDTGGATGNLLDVDTSVSLCGVDVVVLTSHTQDCTSAGPTAATSSAPVLGDVDAAVDVCGVQVVVIGRDDVDCAPSGGNQSGGATGTLSDALLALGLDVAACGVQVAVAGAANANCTGSGATDDATGAVSDALVGLALGAAACGVQAAVAGSTSTDCTGRDTGTGSPACVAGEACAVVVAELCGIAVSVVGSTTTTCQAVTDPGSGPTDPGSGPIDPGSGPTDPGSGPTDPGSGPTDPGSNPPAPGETGAGTTPGGGGAGSDAGSVAGDDDAGSGGLLGDAALPMAGLTIGSLLAAAAVVLITGLFARRIRGAPTLD
jgi:hypothetical protein